MGCTVSASRSSGLFDAHQMAYYAPAQLSCSGGLAAPPSRLATLIPSGKLFCLVLPAVESLLAQHAQAYTPGQSLPDQQRVISSSRVCTHESLVVADRMGVNSPDNR